MNNHISILIYISELLKLATSRLADKVEITLYTTFDLPSQTTDYLVDSIHPAIPEGCSIPSCNLQRFKLNPGNIRYFATGASSEWNTTRLYTTRLLTIMPV